MTGKASQASSRLWAPSPMQQEIEGLCHVILVQFYCLIIYFLTYLYFASHLQTFRWYLIVFQAVSSINSIFQKTLIRCSSRYPSTVSVRSNATDTAVTLLQSHINAAYDMLANFKELGKAITLSAHAGLMKIRTATLCVGSHRVTSSEGSNNRLLSVISTYWVLQAYQQEDQHDGIQVVWGLAHICPKAAVALPWPRLPAIHDPEWC